MTSRFDQEKKAAARYATGLVQNGMMAGLGSGSTSGWAVRFLGEKVRRGELRIEGVCTSNSTGELAREYGIPVRPLDGSVELDIYLDGADEVAPDGSMVKGGGGAHLREKMVALCARRRVIMIHSTKRVERLGDAFPLPVEIVSFGFEKTMARLDAVDGCEPRLRMTEGTPFVTDGGNYIADCRFEGGIEDLPRTARELKLLTGVVETGLFLGLCDLLVTGVEDKVETKEFSESAAR